MSCNNADNGSFCSCSCETKDVVPEFVPGKEYAVGEFFKINNEVFKVTREINWYSCEPCDFNKTDNCGALNCTNSERTDRTQVQAILYDTEE